MIETTGDPVVKSSWKPRWRVDVGSGCEAGLTVDDHCYVVLLPSYTTSSAEPFEWRPTSWIPKAVALKMAELGVEAL